MQARHVLMAAANVATVQLFLGRPFRVHESHSTEKGRSLHMLRTTNGIVFRSPTPRRRDGRLILSTSTLDVSRFHALCIPIHRYVAILRTANFIIARLMLRGARVLKIENNLIVDACR